MAFGDAEDLLAERPHHFSYADEDAPIVARRVAAPDPTTRPAREVVLDPMDVAAPVPGTGTELALDVEASLLSNDPAEAATAKAAPRSPLDHVPQPKIFDTPTSNYAPMMLDDLLQSEEETVAATPMDPLRRAV